MKNENDGKGWLATNVWWFINHPWGIAKALLFWIRMRVSAPIHLPISGILIGVSLFVSWPLNSILPLMGIWRLLALGAIVLTTWFVGLLIILGGDKRDIPHGTILMCTSVLTGPLWCALVPLVWELAKLF